MSSSRRDILQVAQVGRIFCGAWRWRPQNGVLHPKATVRGKASERGGYGERGRGGECEARCGLLSDTCASRSEPLACPRVTSKKTPYTGWYQRKGGAMGGRCGACERVLKEWKEGGAAVGRVAVPS